MGVMKPLNYIVREGGGGGLGELTEISSIVEYAFVIYYKGLEPVLFSAVVVVAPWHKAGFYLKHIS